MTWAWYLVEGLNPEPWQASKAARGANHINFFKPEGLRVYQESLKEMFVEQNPQAVDVPGDIRLWFFFWRQLNLNEMFEGKNTRTHVADATNLQKSTEDALQGVLFANDRNVRDARSVIIAQSDDTEPAILIGIGGYHDEAEEAQDAAAIRASLQGAYDPDARGDNIRDLDVKSVF